MRTLVRRMVDSNEKETAQLRRLIVEQDCFGDVFSRAAHLVSKMPSLSVEAVAKHETFIVGLLKRLYEKYPNRSGETRSVISPLRQDSLLNEYESAENKMIDQILKELPVGSELLARGTSALVYKVPILSAHVVLKVANPYFYIKARCFTGPALAVNQNLSLRRHVRRALIADIINKRFSAYGLRAPIKKLCLRQGASPEGPVDDRFMVVVSQFIEQPDSFLSGEATDEQVMNALRIMQLMKSTDVCASNVILLPSTDPSRALDFMFIDTETPYQVGKRLDHLSDVLRIHSYSYFFRSQPFHDKLRNEKTELQRKQVLERRVAPRELDNYLHERVKALVKDIESDCVEPMHLPARDYERIYLQRTRLSEYLNILMKKEWLTEAQVEVIKNFWMGPDIHHGFLLLNIILIFNSRRAYLNGMTSNIGWNVKDLSDDEIEAFKVYESEFLEKHPSMDSKKTENGALEGRRRRE